MKKPLAKRKFYQSAKRYDDYLDEQLERIGCLDREELIERWDRLFGCLPYKGIRTPTVIRALAFDEQVKLTDGLKPSVSKKLIKIAQSLIQN